MTPQQEILEQAKLIYGRNKIQNNGSSRVQEYGLTGKGHKETFSGDGNALTLTEV